LCENGHNKKVNQSNLEEYIVLFCERRFTAGSQQIKWIQSGMSQIIAPNIVGILSWSDVEDRCAGNKTLDLEKLKSKTDYQHCSKDDKVVKFFWNVLARMSEEDQTAYLKFVWGRARMPIDVTGMQNHCIEVTENSTDSLPEAHTCWF